MDLLFITCILLLVSSWPQMIVTTATTATPKNAAALRYKARVARELCAVRVQLCAVEVQNCVDFLVNHLVKEEEEALWIARVHSAGVVPASSGHMQQLDFSKPLVNQLHVVHHIHNPSLPFAGVPTLAHAGPSFRGANASKKLGTELRPLPVKRKAESRGEPTRRSQRTAVVLRCMQPVVYTKPSTGAQLVVLYVCLDNGVPVFVEMDSKVDHCEYQESIGCVDARLQPLVYDSSDEDVMSLFERHVVGYEVALRYLMDGGYAERLYHVVYIAKHMSGPMPLPTEIPSWVGKGLVAWLVVGAGSGAVHEGIRMQLAGGDAASLVVMIAESNSVSRCVCDPPMHPCIRPILGHKGHSQD